MTDAVDGLDLVGWKAIASYLGVSVDTARRWAREEGLPAERLMGNARASRAALDVWARERISPMGPRGF